MTLPDGPHRQSSFPCPRNTRNELRSAVDRQPINPESETRPSNRHEIPPRNRTAQDRRPLQHEGRHRPPPLRDDEAEGVRSRGFRTRKPSTPAGATGHAASAGSHAARGHAPVERCGATAASVLSIIGARDRRALPASSHEERPARDGRLSHRRPGAVPDSRIRQMSCDCIEGRSGRSDIMTAAVFTGRCDRATVEHQ